MSRLPAIQELPPTKLPIPFVPAASHCPSSRIQLIVLDRPTGLEGRIHKHQQCDGTQKQGKADKQTRAALLPSKPPSGTSPLLSDRYEDPAGVLLRGPAVTTAASRSAVSIPNSDHHGNRKLFTSASSCGRKRFQVRESRVPTVRKRAPSPSLFALIFLLGEP